MAAIEKKSKHSNKCKRMAAVLLSIALAGSVLGGCLNSPTLTSAPTTVTTTAVTSATSETTAATSEATQPSRPAETILTLHLEGSEEKIAAELFNSDLGYSIYMESDKYQYSTAVSQIDSSSNADRFTPVEALGQNYEMFLEIGHLDNMTRDDALIKMKDQLISRFPGLTQEGDIGVGVNKLDALVLHGSNGTEWNSQAFTSAVFSDGGDGVYYYIIVYIFQASEGYASRFNQYLDTFRIE